MVGKTHEIEKQVDTLVSEARATDTRVNNVYNDFLMLSNIQFVESVSNVLYVYIYTSHYIYTCTLYVHIDSSSSLPPSHSYPLLFLLHLLHNIRLICKCSM